jgi:hypothetical protein
MKGMYTTLDMTRLGLFLNSEVLSRYLLSREGSFNFLWNKALTERFNREILLETDKSTLWIDSTNTSLTTKQHHSISDY